MKGGFFQERKLTSYQNMFSSYLLLVPTLVTVRGHFLMAFISREDGKSRRQQKLHVRDATYGSKAQSKLVEYIVLQR